jgi:hypothetical protein
VLFGVLFFGVIGYLILSLEHSVPTPQGWSQELKIYKRTFTGLTRVVDSKTGDTLLLYMDGSPAVQPIKVERVDNNHWIITLEKPRY